MHLIGVARPVPPPWEPGMGWRVLDPDGHVVGAGGQTVAHATLDLLESLGALDQIPVLSPDASRERRGD